MVFVKWHTEVQNDTQKLPLLFFYLEKADGFEQ